MAMTSQPERSTGTIKWYNRKKGFGFVAPDRGSTDIFVHRTALPNASNPLETGDRIIFTLDQGKKGPFATEVMPLAAQPLVEPATDSITDFADLRLNDALLRAVKEVGYNTPTPIQAQAIPHVRAGRDLLGCAQTGTGKTAAFALPILQRLISNPSTTSGPQFKHGTGRNKRRITAHPLRVLVLSPTRELAIQTGSSFSAYGHYTGLTNAVIYGGVGQRPQIDALKRGIDVLVATPGRLLDLMGQGFVNLNTIDILVFDEADRMLDMGFIRDVRRILKAVPKQRQTLLFSATLPPEIIELAEDILIDPLEISIAPEQPTVEAIEQTVYFVSKKRKQDLLEHVLHDKSVTRALVFSRTKHGANRIAKHLTHAGIQAEPIHGNKSQTGRQQALSNFRNGLTRVLVATDVVARGIDVENISHVIQFDLPHEPETYVHRIGRTGRAGATGIAVSFCADNEQSYLRDIERLIRMKLSVKRNHPYSQKTS